jgi:hypothetical protein
MDFLGYVTLNASCANVFASVVIECRSLMEDGENAFLFASRTKSLNVVVDVAVCVPE